MGDPAHFAGAVFNYRLLPWPLSVATALYLPWLEIFCGAALASRFLYKGALTVVTLLTCVFAAVLLSAWLRGLNVECGCFGRSSSNISEALLRDGFLLLAVGFLWLKEVRVSRS